MYYIYVCTLYMKLKIFSPSPKPVFTLLGLIYALADVSLPTST